MANALFLCIGTKHTGSNLNFDAILFISKSGAMPKGVEWSF